MCLEHFRSSLHFIIENGNPRRPIIAVIYARKSNHVQKKKKAPSNPERSHSSAI